MRAAPALDCQAQQPNCFVGVRRIEDRADRARDGHSLIELGDIPLCVVLQVKLAALPRHASEHGFACGLETGVIVAGNELDPTQTALDQAVQQRSPVDLGFGQSTDTPSTRQWPLTVTPTATSTAQSTT